MKQISLTFFSFLFCVHSIVAQDNPFMPMADKKYADYSVQLGEEFWKFIWLDTMEARKVVNQIKEVAEKTGSIDWKLQVEFYEWVMFNKKYYYDNQSGYDSLEANIQGVFDLITKARKAGVPQVELKCMHEIFVFYVHNKQYEHAFEQSDVLAERLQEISSRDIPEKTLYYIGIANLYYDFKNYPKAIFYYKKALSDKVTAANQRHRLGALNNLGLVYRYGFNDYDRSDSCFRAILQTEYLDPKDEAIRENWDGIAQGNIGRNMLLRGEYDNAIPLLKSSIEKMLKFGDYAYATLPAIFLASIYLEKGNTAEAKRYIDLSVDYYAKWSRDGNLLHIYEISSKYYATVGNAKLSIAYMDSTLAEKERLDKQFNALQMMRVEQRKHLSEQKIKDEQLQTEKVRSIGYQRSLLIALGGLLLFGSLLVRYIALYRKKRNAYQELILKSQEWAQGETKRVDESELIEPADTESVEQEQAIQSGIPDEVDFLIMNEIERIMSDENLYEDTSLSVDLLAQKLNLKQYNISAAINHCKKKNFTAFVNEYRIKEAILLLSEKNTKFFSIDQISFNVGFNDRKNFHRVFKKMTGLSPREFRKNMKNE